MTHHRCVTNAMTTRINVNYSPLAALLLTICTATAQTTWDGGVYDAVPGLAPSDKYTVRVCAATNTTTWKSAFVWQTACLTNSATDAYFSALFNWTHSYVNFEMTKPVVVEIARVGGANISTAVVHPARLATACVVTNGKAYVTLNNPCNVAVDINGQMDAQNTGYMKSGGRYAGPPIHTISLHANPPLAGKPATNDPSVYLVVPGTTPPTNGSWTTLYFLPGIHHIGLAYPLRANHQYYIPGDAIVYGTSYCSSGGQGICIFGHGTLSESGWQNPKHVVPTPANFNIYHPIHISGAKNTSVEGITIADPAYHALMMYGSYDSSKYTISSWVKIFGWRANGDGINPFGNGQMRNCFIRTQDDCSYVNGAGISDTVFWNDANGSSFVLTALPNLTSRTLLIHDCDVIYSRASWINWSGGRVFNMRGSGSGACGGGIVFSNINIEDPRPTMQQFFVCMQMLSPYSSSSPQPSRSAGDLSGVRFINVSIAATNRNSEPEILWGATNGQASIHDLTFDNLTVGGVTVLTNIFMTNAYVSNLRFTNSTPRAITGLAATNTAISFSVASNGSYVGLPGANGASIFAVTNNGLWMVQATSNPSSATWVPIATNRSPFIFSEPVTNSQRFYRAVAP